MSAASFLISHVGWLAKQAMKNLASLLFLQVLVPPGMLPIVAPAPMPSPTPVGGNDNSPSPMTMPSPTLMPSPDYMPTPAPTYGGVGYGGVGGGMSSPVFTPVPTPDYYPSPSPAYGGVGGGFPAPSPTYGGVGYGGPPVVPPAVGSTTILGLANSIPQLSTLAVAVSACPPVFAASSNPSTMVTAYLPNNDAFAACLADLGLSSITDLIVNQPVLCQILQYHLSPEIVLTGSLTYTPITVPTLLPNANLTLVVDR